MPRFALTQATPRGSEVVDRPETPLTPAPPSVAPVSKGPPPLPKAAPPALLSEDCASAEQLFFREGIDGHAERVPPSGRYPFPLAGTNPLAVGSTIPPTSIDEEWLDLDEDVEDPERTRRRRAARIGTAWATIVAVAVVGVALFMSPPRDLRSAAASSSPATIETVARPPAATPSLASPPSQGRPPVPEVAAPLLPAPRAALASGSAAAPASPRTAARAPAPSLPATRPPSTSPRAPSVRATRARHAQPIRSGPNGRSSVHPSLAAATP